jgi:Trm5-related predicted tRNA methylase
MTTTPRHPPLPDVADLRAADVVTWARLLDEHPAEIQRAIGQAGADLGAIRRYLWSRQLGLDFDPPPAEVAASASSQRSA